MPCDWDRGRKSPQRRTAVMVRMNFMIQRMDFFDGFFEYSLIDL